MKELLTYSSLAVLVALSAACDKVPLLAPTGSTINLSANATTVPANGSVGLTAFVTESSGTPVQNGTTVRFTTTLGTVTPSEAQTTNGIAIATFQAGSNSGVAEVRAISGGASGTSGSGASATSTNTVKITIGGAAVNTISVSASPSTVSASGGSVNVTATVLDTNGGTLAGIPVTFTADQGVVAPSVVTTDASGQATSTLVTSVDTTVTAAAGTKTATVKVTARGGPVLTITCAPTTGTSCASVQANGSNNATVSFTIKKGTGSTAIRDATIDFGDGTTQALGTLTSDTTVSHTYQGPTSSSQAAYAVTVRATDVNGEATSASTIVNVTARAAFGVNVSASSSTPKVNTPVEFTATITGDTSAPVTSYEWTFTDSNGSTKVTTSGNKVTRVFETTGTKTIDVTAKTSDGRSASSQTQIVVQP